MKDRFKFRAWDNSQKIMFYDVQDTYDFNYTHRDNEELTPAEHFGQLLSEKNIIVEQCVGFKDKYEKLIYEGDIVNILPEEELAVISWDSDRACVVFETEDVCYSFDNFFSYELEVIGNIHENPELLEL